MSSLPGEMNPAAPQQPAATELEYVGFWLRVLAAIIDTIMLLVVTTPLTYVFYGRISSPSGEMFRGPMDVLINWLLPAALVILLWRQLGATPGKMALGAKIVDADTGNAPTTTQFIIRYVGYFVSTIPFALGLMWVGWDRRKQGWHDKMANTVVVRPKRADGVRFEKGSQ